MATTCTKVIPILRMFDEALTRQFYLEFLEFGLRFEHRFSDNSPLYMGVKKGAVELNLSGHFGDGSPGIAVRIETTELDDFAAALRAKQYKHANPGCPEDQPWGCRELAIQDPSGNKLIFYTNQPVS